MALQDPQAEPSMEEILASIRRIISEEEQAPAPEPVLDLGKGGPGIVERHRPIAQSVDDEGQRLKVLPVVIDNHYGGRFGR